MSTSPSCYVESAHKRLPECYFWDSFWDTLKMIEQIAAQGRKPMLLLYMGFYGLLHCAEKGKNGFESGPVRHLSNAKIFLSSPKKIQMSENPRVRQIAKAIWTFGCAERPEGVKKAPRLLESFPSGPPFVKC